MDSERTYLLRQITVTDSRRSTSDRGASVHLEPNKKLEPSQLVGDNAVVAGATFCTRWILSIRPLEFVPKPTELSRLDDAGSLFFVSGQEGRVTDSLDFDAETLRNSACDKIEKFPEIVAISNYVDFGLGDEPRIIEMYSTEQRLQGIFWIAVSVLVDKYQTSVRVQYGTRRSRIPEGWGSFFPQMLAIEDGIE